MASPLFQVASAAVRRSAVKQFRGSTYGKLLAEVEAVKAMPSKLRPQNVSRIAQKYGRQLRPDQIAKEVLGKDFGKFVRHVERYAKSGGLGSKLVDDLLAGFGPAGTLIRSLIGTGAITGKAGIERELDAARKLLEAFGQLPPGGSPTVGQMRQGAQGLIEWLSESMGVPVAERLPELPTAERLPDLPEGQQVAPLPFGVSKTTSRGQLRKTVTLPDPSGNLRLPVSHPAVTGEFVSVDSSNVHSISYDAENALLYVRYLAPAGAGQTRTQPGSLYQYRDITPRMFDAMYKAASKGGWVWDNLRIRGTTAGYQKPYALVGVMNGYVPRQATIVAGGEERYIPRQLFVGKGQWLQSQLQEGPATPFTRGVLRPGRPRGPRA